MGLSHGAYKSCAGSVLNQYTLHIGPVVILLRGLDSRCFGEQVVVFPYHGLI